MNSSKTILASFLHNARGRSRFVVTLPFRHFGGATVSATQKLGPNPVVVPEKVSQQ